MGIEFGPTEDHGQMILRMRATEDGSGAQYLILSCDIEGCQRVVCLPLDAKGDYRTLAKGNQLAHHSYFTPIEGQENKPWITIGNSAAHGYPEGIEFDTSVFDDFLDSLNLGAPNDDSGDDIS